MLKNKSLNYKTLTIFAPILILTGLLGFILPNSFTSNAAPYNIFHIIFGIIGLICVFSKREDFIRGFNISFGLIDLYQAAASFMNWFPEQHFQWKIADDYLHIIIGSALILISFLARRNN